MFLSVIISVWGDPTFWSPVKYHVEDMESKDYKASSRDYKSTLGALMELYGDARVLLFVASTLVEFSGRVFNGYREVVDYVNLKVKNYLESGEYCVDSGRIELKVLPGIGRFKPRGSGLVNFIGDINAFRVAASISAYEFISRMNPETLILDISHGINYMPVYVRQSVYDAFNAYVALGGKKEARWVVYNSEPFSREANVKDLRLNIVEDVEIDVLKGRNHLYNEFESLYVDGNFNPYEPNVKKLESIHEWRKLNESAIKFVKFSTTGLIIPLIDAMKGLIEIKREKLMNELKKYSYLENCDDIVKITANENSLNIQYLYTPQYQTILMIFIRDIVEKLSDKEIIEIENTYEIETLKRIAEKFIREPGKTLVKNEISQIKERTEICEKLQIKLNEWTPYKTIIEISEKPVKIEDKNIKKLITIYRDYKNKKIEEEKFKEILMKGIENIQEDIEKSMKTKSIDKRNFIAHASLESNITLISTRNGKIYLKYSTENNMQEQLNRILKEIIKQ